jgi:hypothetical protein
VAIDHREVEVKIPEIMFKVFNQMMDTWTELTANEFRAIDATIKHQLSQQLRNQLMGQMISFMQAYQQFFVSMPNRLNAEVNQIIHEHLTKDLPVEECMKAVEEHLLNNGIDNVAGELKEAVEQAYLKNN